MAKDENSEREIGKENKTLCRVHPKYSKLHFPLPSNRLYIDLRVSSVGQMLSGYSNSHKVSLAHVPVSGFSEGGTMRLSNTAAKPPVFAYVPLASTTFSNHIDEMILMQQYMHLDFEKSDATPILKIPQLEEVQ